MFGIGNLVWLVLELGGGDGMHVDVCIAAPQAPAGLSSVAHMLKFLPKTSSALWISSLKHTFPSGGQ